MANTTKINVRYNETDAMGVVHHAVYPVWFEMARTDYIKAIGYSYSRMEENGVMLPVTGLSLKYKRPAKYDDDVLVNVRITRLTPARIEFAYTITRCSDSETLVVGESAHAFVDAADFKPLNFKKAMPEFFDTLEREAQKDIQG